MKLFRLTVATAAVMLACSAHAGLVTIDGSDVAFTYDPGSFVDGPGISGNGASFLTNSISAAAGGTALNGSETTDSSVSFIITLTNPHDVFSSISLSEHGTYQLSGPSSSVSIAGSRMSLSALNQTGSLVTAITPSTSVSNHDGVAHGWAAGASEDLSAGSLSGDRSIKVTIYNMLTANASAGSTAEISAGFAGNGSNDDGLGVGVSTVPLPASAPLFGAALLALLGVGLKGRTRRRLAAQQ